MWYVMVELQGLTLWLTPFGVEALSSCEALKATFAAEYGDLPECVKL